MAQSSDCIFCKIASGQIPAKFAFQDDEIVAFHDLNPQAPTHVLLIPRTHIPSLAHAEEQHEPLLGRLLATSAKLADQLGLANGYRAVLNIGPNGGQTVDHLHLHLLGGRAMHWPPG